MFRGGRHDEVLQSNLSLCKHIITGNNLLVDFKPPLIRSSTEEWIFGRWCLRLYLLFFQYFPAQIRLNKDLAKL